MKSIYIMGLQTKLGSEVKTIEEIAAEHGKNSERELRKIRMRTGVSNVHRFSKNVPLFAHAGQAVEAAASEANLDPEDLIGIYSSTAGPTDMFLMPGIAYTIGRFFQRDIPTISIGMGCAGGLQALEAAYNKLYRNGTSRDALVVIGDQTSLMLDGRWETAPLFSEGVAALVLSSYSDAPIDAWRVTDVQCINRCTSSGEEAMAMHIKNPQWYGDVDRLTFEMDGVLTAQFAVDHALPMGLAALGLDSLPEEAYFIPHQASGFILEHMIERHHLDPRMVYTDGIREIGNTSGASVFFGLQDAQKKGYIQGKDVILLAYGAENAVGAAYLKWEEAMEE